MTDHTCSDRKFLPVFAALFFLILIIYSNTFHTSWHLDDYPKIVNNSRMHLEEISLEALGDAFTAYRGRPVSSFTLALNWYFGQKKVIGYHIVNLSIHVLSSWFLFLACLTLFQSPNLRNRYQGSEHFIAALAAVLWAINPIQIQAVTYIVQRMASLCAMLYILSLYFYLQGRLHGKGKNRFYAYLACLICFLLALGSKENAILFPFTLVLVEFIFFQNVRHPKRRWPVLSQVVVAGGIAAIILGAVFLIRGNLFGFLAGYGGRDFSLWERLLTQPRIIFFYLSQLFYPVSQRLSIAHDILVSTSLFQPVSTFPAVLGVIGLIGYGLMQIRKMPLLSFGILFFFLNHGIESTIIPLELIFEHRNYLPSMFLFLPVAAGLKQLLTRYREKRFMYLMIVSFVTILLAGIGTGTYHRNWIWSNATTLWEDAVRKAPGSARAYHNLALGYQRSGRSVEALELYKMALQRTGARKESPAFLLNNMGGIYYGWGEYEKAAEHLRKALDYYPKYRSANYLLTLSLIQLGRWKDAEENLDLLLEKELTNEAYLSLKGFILLKQNSIQGAVTWFQRGLRLSYKNRDSLIFMGAAMGMLGEYDRGLWFLRQADALYENDPVVMLCIADNYLKAEMKSQAAHFIDRFIDTVGMNRLEIFLKNVQHDNLAVPCPFEHLLPFIAERIERKAIDNHKLADRLLKRYSAAGF